jgi:hypothetical protein
MPESVLSRLARSTKLSKTEPRSAGAARIQSSQRHTSAPSGRPRNPSNIPRAEKPVNASIAQNFHRILHSENFRTANLGGFEPRISLGPSTARLKPRPCQTRATVWPSASPALIQRTGLFRPGEAEDRKLRKELAFGGPCLEGTLQKPTLVSESSPVAGTN